MDMASPSLSFPSLFHTRPSLLIDMVCVRVCLFVCNWCAIVSHTNKHTHTLIIHTHRETHRQRERERERERERSTSTHKHTLTIVRQTVMPISCPFASSYVCVCVYIYTSTYQ